MVAERLAAYGQMTPPGDLLGQKLLDDCGNGDERVAWDRIDAGANIRYKD